MRRRRQKNNLLMKVLAFSILINAGVLAVMAQFGGLKKMQREFFPVQMVSLPPPVAEHHEERVEHHVQHNAAAPVHRAAGPSRSVAHADHTPYHGPKLMSTGGGPTQQGGGGGGDDVPEGGSVGAGSLNTGSGDGGQKGQKADTPVAPPPPTQPTTHVAETKPQPIIKPQPAVADLTQVKPMPQPAPPPPKPPVFTGAEPVGGTDGQPKPSIPDDLRHDAVDKTCVARFTVGPDGVPTDVQIVQGTGISELDRSALDAARKWRFKPATKDGEPVDGQVELQIEFQVN